MLSRHWAPEVLNEQRRRRIGKPRLARGRNRQHPREQRQITELENPSDRRLNCSRSPAFQPDEAYSPACDFNVNYARASAIPATPSPSAFNVQPWNDAPIDGMPDDSAASVNANQNWYTPFAGLLWDDNKSRASVTGAGMPLAPVDFPNNANYSGGLLGRYLALAGLDPENSKQPAPPSPDDEQEQANLRELDARLSRTGDIRDAVALYNARKAGRARGTFDQP